MKCCADAIDNPPHIPLEPPLSSVLLWKLIAAIYFKYHLLYPPAFSSIFGISKGYLQGNLRVLGVKFHQSSLSQ